MLKSLSSFELNLNSIYSGFVNMFESIPFRKVLNSGKTKIILDKLFRSLIFKVIISFVGILLIWRIYQLLTTKSKLKKFFKGKNYIVTGGSSGIGYSIAKTLLQNGANVMIVARNESKLILAMEKLQEVILDTYKNKSSKEKEQIMASFTRSQNVNKQYKNRNGNSSKSIYENTEDNDKRIFDDSFPRKDILKAMNKITYLSCDVTLPVETVQSKFHNAIKALDPDEMIDGIVLCAGTSYALPFDEVNVNVFNDLYQSNVMGSVIPAQIVLPYIKKRGIKAGGSVTFISSQAGQVGLYGYSA